MSLQAPVSLFIVLTLIPIHSQAHVAHQAVTNLPVALCDGIFHRQLRIHKVHGKRNVFLLYYEHPVLARIEWMVQAMRLPRAPDATSMAATHHFIVEEPGGRLRREPVPQESIYAKPALLYITEDLAIQQCWDHGTIPTMVLVNATGAVLATFDGLNHYTVPLAADVKNGLLYARAGVGTLTCFHLRTGRCIHKQTPLLYRIIDVVVPAEQTSGAASESVDVYILHVRLGDQRGRLAMGVWNQSESHLHIVRAIVFSWTRSSSIDGALAVSCRHVYMSCHRDGVVHVVAVDDGAATHEHTLDILERANSVAVTDSGRMLFTLGNRDTTLYATHSCRI